MKKIKIKKGDKVKVIAGKSKGLISEVLSVVYRDDKVVVKNAAMVKKHVKATNSSPCRVVEKEMPIHISNIAYYIDGMDTHSKLGYKCDSSGKKVRFAKKQG